MASRKHPETASGQGAEQAPAWANGLKQLYDEVVEEPLPASFKDLLAQLDAADGSGADTQEDPAQSGGS